MTLTLALALLALLVALFTLVALTAVYARVRALEAGRGVSLSGYPSLVGRPAPASVRPRAGERLAIVAVLDTDCATCHAVWTALADVAAEQADVPARFVGLLDREPPADAFRPAARCELLADVGTRSELFEGYSPTLLALDAAGIIRHRSFVYPDTDLRTLLLDLVKREGG